MACLAELSRVVVLALGFTNVWSRAESPSARGGHLNRGCQWPAAGAGSQCRLFQCFNLELLHRGDGSPPLRTRDDVRHNAYVSRVNIGVDLHTRN